MPQNRQRPTNKDAISAAKEIVDLVGFGLGNLMLRIYRGDVHKNNCTDDWTDEDRTRVSGTVLFLLGGSIGTHGYIRQILPLIAQRRIGEVDTEFAEQVCIFTPPMESAQAGALGAYFLAVPEAAKQSKGVRSLILLFIMKADSFLTVCLWLNNAAQDNQPLPAGYNCTFQPILLFLCFFLVS